MQSAKTRFSLTQNLAALPFDLRHRVVVDGQVDCNRAQGPRRSIGTPFSARKSSGIPTSSTWLSHLLAEPDGPRVDEGTFSTPTLPAIYAAVASILSLANPKRLGDRSLLGGPAPVRQLARLKAIYPPRESVGSVCACEQVTGTSARYACSEEHDHECKPSPHRHTSASTSGEKAGQTARADCGSTGDRTGCARSKGAANLFTIPLDDERETASSGGLAP